MIQIIFDAIPLLTEITLDDDRFFTSDELIQVVKAHSERYLVSNFVNVKIQKLL